LVKKICHFQLYRTVLLSQSAMRARIAYWVATGEALACGSNGAQHEL
jgi:hypothetical protein